MKIALFAFLLLALVPPAFAKHREDLEPLVQTTNDLKKQEQAATPEEKPEIKKKIDETIGKMDKIGDSEPEVADTQKEVARAMLSADEPKRAVNRANQAIELAPQDPEARVIRGESYFSMHRYDDAASDAKRALELDPQNEEAQKLLALAHTRDNGQVPKNLEMLQTGGGDAAATGPGPSAARAAATPTRPRPDMVAAQATADKIKAADFVAQATSKMGLGDNMAALGLLDKAVALDAKNADARVTRAWLRLPKSGGAPDMFGALEDARQATALAPRSGPAHAVLGEALEASGATKDEVLAEFKQAAKLDASLAETYELALQRWASGKPEGAQGSAAAEASGAGGGAPQAEAAVDGTTAASPAAPAASHSGAPAGSHEGWKLFGLAAAGFAAAFFWQGRKRPA
jgi:tetratricopeptide (TPR) repeat protein